MKTEITENTAYFSGDEMNPEIVFECGQAFRFNPRDNGYFGIAHGMPLNVEKAANGFKIWPVTADAVENTWKRYFTIDKDYCTIKKILSSDEIVKEAIPYCCGMRLLMQEPFETLITFIISANNNIKRIKGIVEKICALSGEAVIYEGEKYHAFPTPAALASLSEADLTACGAGYRAPYICETACAVRDGFDLDVIFSMDYEAARKYLMTLKGVGPKVADCILLFAFDKQEAFPRDVWIKRVLKTLYDFEPKNEKELLDFAEKKYSGYGGIAQQYLFHYARVKKLL